MMEAHIKEYGVRLKKQLILDYILTGIIPVFKEDKDYLDFFTEICKYKINLIQTTHDLVEEEIELGGTTYAIGTHTVQDLASVEKGLIKDVLYEVNNREVGYNKILWRLKPNFYVNDNMFIGTMRFEIGK